MANVFKSAGYFDGMTFEEMLDNENGVLDELNANGRLKTLIMQGKAKALEAHRLVKLPCDRFPENAL